MFTWESRTKSDCLKTTGDELLPFSSVQEIEFTLCVDPFELTSNIFLFMSPRKDVMPVLPPFWRESMFVLY